MVDRKKTLNISKAIKKPGSFTAQAKRKGMTVPQYIKFVLDPKNAKKTTETTKRRARFAKTLAKVRK
jgi:hydroxymethylglutaryl-CoA reductase